MTIAEKRAMSIVLVYLTTLALTVQVLAQKTIILSQMLRKFLSIELQVDCRHRGLKLLLNDRFAGTCST